MERQGGSLFGTYVNTTLVDKDACFDLPVGKAGMEWEGNILMHRLESLEDKGIAGRSRFNAVEEGSINDIDKK